MECAGERGRMGKVLDFSGREVLESGRAEAAWNGAGTFDFGYQSYMAMVDGGADVDVWYRAHREDPETPQPFKDGMDAARAELAARGGLRLVD